MDLTTEGVWRELGPNLYLFIQKRVGDAAVAKDIFQNTFLKVHEHLEKLQDTAKIKPWVFQIARNELINHYRGSSSHVDLNEQIQPQLSPEDIDFCCFDRFLNELPKDYQKTVTLVYIEGKTNSEAANTLGISLANVKARIRRVKKILIHRFQECCLYKTNELGKLVGKPDCGRCSL
ncbi:MAG: sigma-70 family RNA polymerase sigma factor [Bacteroidota bacterium]